MLQVAGRRIAHRIGQRSLPLAAPPRSSDAATLALAVRRLPLGASRAAASGSSSSDQGQSSSDAGGSSSDQRYEQTGEYDTQDRYKRVGNPISWANPTGGGTVEDTSSKHWRWVYPAGAGFILFLCMISRWRNMRKEKEEEVIEAPNISVPDTRQFSYKPPSAEPLRPQDLVDSDPAQTGGAPGDTLSTSYGAGGFSAPPSSYQSR